MTFCRIKKILEANGWYLVRIRGSHNQFRKAGNPYAVTVPDHGSRDITIGVIKDL
ncbi:type II toxin-antitoxin system HicA family toxin, partial [Firmicutes bacterium AF25-13AC]